MTTPTEIITKISNWPCTMQPMAAVDVLEHLKDVGLIVSRSAVESWMYRNFEKTQRGVYNVNLRDLGLHFARRRYPDSFRDKVIMSSAGANVIDAELFKVVQRLEEENGKLRDWRDLHRELAKEAFAIVKHDEIIQPEFDNAADSYCEFFLQLSDWHLGDGYAYTLGKYNEAMLRVMVDMLIHKVKKCVADAPVPVRALNILLGGDLLHGDGIYPKQHLTLLYATHRQLAIFVQIAEHLVRELAACVPKLRIFAVRGNHGRTGDKWSSIHPNSNWDMAGYIWLQEATKDVAEWRIAEDDEHLMVSISGLVMVLSHGDHVRISQRVPWYGVEDYMRATAEWFADKPYKSRIIFIGHLHHSFTTQTDSAAMYCNGALQGFTPYAKNGRFSPQPRMQNLICWGWGIEEQPIELSFQKLWLGKGVDASGIEEIEI